MTKIECTQERVPTTRRKTLHRGSHIREVARHVKHEVVDVERVDKPRFEVELG